MAYDEHLAARVRALLEGEADLTEKKMFGGLAFLIGGNMAVAASGQGGLLVRADPESSDALLTSTGVRPMEMRGRQMQAGCAWTTRPSARSASSRGGRVWARGTPGRCPRRGRPAKERVVT